MNVAMIILIHIFLDERNVLLVWMLKPLGEALLDMNVGVSRRMNVRVAVRRWRYAIGWLIEDPLHCMEMFYNK